ncbi:hypothetical protein [Pannonibacter phragmitetus]
MSQLIVLHPDDNVGIVKERLAAGSDPLGLGVALATPSHRATRWP